MAAALRADIKSSSAKPKKPTQNAAQCIHEQIIDIRNSRTKQLAQFDKK